MSAVKITYSKQSGSVFALGTTVVTVTATDAAGNVTTRTFKVTVVDTTAPTGSIQIDCGTAKTTTGRVTITLNFHDAVGPVRMRFSTDGGATWTAWEPYATTKALTLTRPDGTKTVIAQVADAAGNIGTASDSITLSTRGDDCNGHGNDWTASATMTTTGVTITTAVTTAAAATTTGGNTAAAATRDAVMTTVTVTEATTANVIADHPCSGASDQTRGAVVGRASRRRESAHLPRQTDCSPNQEEPMPLDQALRGSSRTDMPMRVAATILREWGAMWSENRPRLRGLFSLRYSRGYGVTRTNVPITSS